MVRPAWDSGLVSDPVSGTWQILTKWLVILDTAICGLLSSSPFYPCLCLPAPHETPRWSLTVPSLAFHACVFGFILTYLKGTSSSVMNYRFWTGRWQHDAEAGAWAGKPEIAADLLTPLWQPLCFACHQNPLLFTASQNAWLFSPGDLQCNSWKNQGFKMVTVEFQASAGRGTGLFLKAEFVTGSKRKTRWRALALPSGCLGVLAPKL